MQRLILGLVILLAALGLSARSARADTTGAAWTDPGGIGDLAGTSSGAPAPKGTAPLCQYRRSWIPDDTPIVVFDGDVIPVDGSGHWYERWCDGELDGMDYIRTADPHAVALEAERYLALPLPEPHLSPAGEQVVNLPTWLWIDAADWKPVTSTVGVPGVTVAVTATPTDIVWSTGDGATVDCAGPGTPFDTSIPTTSSCIHTYLRSSAGRSNESYPVSVTVAWNVTWAAVGAPGGGTLGTVDRTTSMQFRVGEIQALNVGAG